MINRLHKIAVIGAGSWGTALSMVLATRECEVVLWTPVEAQARELAETRRNPVLSETAAPLAPNIHPTCDLNLVKDAELIVVVVPSVAMRSVAQQLRDLPVRPDAVIVSCTKGIEQGTHKRMTEILQEYLPSNPIGVLSGPNHAEDICLGLPSASLIGLRIRNMRTGCSKYLPPRPSGFIPLRISSECSSEEPSKTFCHWRRIVRGAEPGG